MEIFPLVFVKSTNVSSNVKMPGEMNSAQKMNTSTVLNHTSVPNINVLGAVKISITLPVISWLSMISMVMDYLIRKTKSKIFMPKLSTSVVILTETTMSMPVKSINMLSWSK